MQAFKNERLGSSKDVAGIRNLVSAEGINQGYDKTLEEALRNARATGSSAGGKIAADVGASRADALRKAFMENQQGAGAEAYNDYSTRTGNEAQLYNMFATRSSALPGVEYNPRNIEGQTANLMQGASSAGGATNQNLLNAISQGLNIQNKFQAQPLMGLGNTISQLGNNIYAGFGGSSSGYGGGYGGSTFTPAPSYGNDYYKNNAGPW
jgi:hypothetical protein